MGSCSAKQIEFKIEEERNIIVDEQQNNKRKKNIRIIKKFILKNIERIKIKKQYENNLAISESLFCNQTTDIGINEQNYYAERFSFKLNEIKEQKKQIFDELFREDITLKLNSFEYLKNKLSSYYNDDIYDNKINFYKDFALELQESEKDKKPYKKGTARKSLNTNFLDFMSNNVKGFTSSKIITGFGVLKFEDINLDKVEKYIKKDIEVLYKYCFNIDKLPTLDICQKRCKLLSLMSDIQYKNKKVNISVEFEKFLKTLYYIILLKKCNCLSSTGENVFFPINKKKIVHSSKKDLRDLLLSNNKPKDSPKLEAKKSVNFTSKRSNVITKKRNKVGSVSYRTGIINKDFSTNFENDNNDIDILGQYNNIHQTSTRIRVPNSKRLKTVIERDSARVIKNLKSINSAQKLFKRIKKSQNLEEEYYSGQYDNTTYLYAGFGTLIEPEKDTLYIGTFKYGQKEGMGILYEESENYNELKLFLGEFRKNKIEGYGEKITLKNNIIYYREGIFSDKIFIHGIVKMIKDNKNNGEIEITNYEGDMSNDLFNGFGILKQKTYALNELKKYDVLYEKEYKGHFKNGKEHGKGTIKFNNGVHNESYQYNGNFVDGLRDGYGVIIYPENFFIQKYEGFFKEDKPFCTYGIVYFKSGDRYEGFFNNNYQKNYIGEYFFCDPVSKIINEHYFGGFRNDSKHGLGKIIFEKKNECKMMTGNFNLGDKHGHFEMNEYKNELVKIKRTNNQRKRISSWNVGEMYENQLQRNQRKFFILFEGNDIMEKSEFPIEV